MKFPALMLFFCALVLGQLQTERQIFGNNLPKGSYIWTFDDGPDRYIFFSNKVGTVLISQLLADPAANHTGKPIVGTFFVNACHFAGADEPSQLSSNCWPIYGEMPTDILAQLSALGHIIGNHGQNHVPGNMLTDPGIVYEVGRPMELLAKYQKTFHPFRPAGFDWDKRIAAVLNSNPQTKNQTGPFNADFIGSGWINGNWIQADWDCFKQFGGQADAYKTCGDLYLQDIKQSDHGGIILIHDRSPYMLGSLKVYQMVDYILQQLHDQVFLSLEDLVVAPEHMSMQ